MFITDTELEVSIIKCTMCTDILLFCTENGQLMENAMFLYEHDVHRLTSLCSALILMLSLSYCIILVLLVNFY